MQLPPPPPPPHAARQLVNPTSTSNIESLAGHRPRHGFAKSKTHARVSSHGNNHRAVPPTLAACEQPTGATVVTVSVAVPPAAVVTFTLPVVPKLNVGRFAAPGGLDVSTAVSTTVPVNPPNGVTVIVD